MARGCTGGRFLGATILVLALALALPSAGSAGRPHVAAAPAYRANALSLGTGATYERTISLANGTAVAGAPAWDGSPVVGTTYDPFTGWDYLSAGGLFALDPRTGALTSLEQTTLIGGLAFDPQSNLIFAGAFQPSRLLGFDPVTGAVRANFSLPGNLTYQVSGITYDPAAGALDAVVSGNEVVAVNATSGAVLRTAVVGSYVYATALDPTDGLLFVGDDYGGYVTVLRTSTFAAVANLTVGGPVAGLAFDRVDDTVGVTLAPPSDDLLAIDAATLTVGSPVTLDGSATIVGPLAYDPGDDTFGVAVLGGPTFTSGWVDLLAGATLTESASVVVGPSPDAISFDSGYDRFDVGSSTALNVTEVDPVSATVVGASSVGTGPDALAVDDAHGLVYVANAQSGTVSVVRESDGRSVGSFSVGADPDGVVLDSVTGVIYIANGGSDNVSVYSPTLGHTVGSFAVPNGATAVAFDPSSRQLFVTGFYGDVTPIDTTNGTVGALLSTAPDLFPVSAAVDPADGEVYVANEAGPGATENVTVFRTSDDAKVATIPVGLEPDSVAYDAATGDVYVANLGGNISVIDPSTHQDIRSISLGAGYIASVAPGPNGTLWVGTFSPDQVWQVEAGTGTIVTKFPAMAYPNAAAYSPVTNTTFVVGTYSSALTTLGPTAPPPPTQYSVTVRESGLPPGTSWSLSTGNGTTFVTTYATVSFGAPNGSLSVSVAPADGWTPTPASFSVVVDGAPLVLNVSFAGGVFPVNRTVTFTETGLPNGTRWTVYIDSGTSTVQLNATAGSPAALGAPDGTYSYAVGALAEWTPTPVTGVFTLAGGPTNVTVAFTAVGSATGGPSSSAPMSGAPVDVVYALAGSVILLACVVAMLALRRPPPTTAASRDPAPTANAPPPASPR